jgi:hypothetical protein
MFDIWSGFSSVRKKFTDVFSSRVDTSSSLGIATDGSKWTAINGIIQVISGKAKSTTMPTALSPGSEYPMAVVTMPTANNTIKIKDVMQGSSVALWVQSSNDWWLVDVDSTFNTIPGTAVYGATGSNYGIVGSNYGVVGSNYGTTGNNYVIVSSNYGAVGSNYAAYGTNYGYAFSTKTTASTYAFSSFRASYTVTNYRSATTSATNYRSAKVGNVINYFASTTNTINYFPTTTTTYSNFTDFAITSYTFAFVNGTTPSGSNFGISGTNYGVNGSNFGIGTAIYGTTGSNYGSISSNYGVSGTNYGQTSTNAITYAYAQYLRIRQSSSSIVNTITSALISTAQTIGSIIVQVSGNTITAKAYSDTNFVTQIGSDLVHTPTGITITTQFGIAISPSEYQQSDIIGSSVEITRL